MQTERRRESKGSNGQREREPREATGRGDTDLDSGPGLIGGAVAAIRSGCVGCNRLSAAEKQ